VTEQGVEGEVGVEEPTRDAAKLPEPRTSKVKADAKSTNNAPRAARKSKKR